jgi:hypothetical protein
MAFLIWRQGDSFGAALALLWPVAVLLIGHLLNTWGLVLTALARRNALQAELDAVRNRFKARLSREPLFPRPGVKSAMTSTKKLEVLSWIVMAAVLLTVGTLAASSVLPIWGAAIIAAVLVFGSPMIACGIAFCFMGPERYLKFIKTAKAQQDETLERQRARRFQSPTPEIQLFGLYLISIVGKKIFLSRVDTCLNVFVRCRRTTGFINGHLPVHLVQIGF